MRLNCRAWIRLSEWEDSRLLELAQRAGRTKSGILRELVRQAIVAPDVQLPTPASTGLQPPQEVKAQ